MIMIITVIDNKDDHYSGIVTDPLFIIQKS